jgi:hypothetical protein
MARIDGVFNDFANHVTSGLSGFITAAYGVCDGFQTPVLRLMLLPEIKVPEPFSGSTSFDLSVRALHDKFIEILAKQMDLSALEQITSLVVEVDFAPDNARVEERRRILASVPVYYGYDPVYCCTVSMQLASGQVRVITQQDRL